jgi:3-dehydroquinate synthetase
VQLGLCPKEDAARATSLIEASGLPTSPSQIGGISWETDVLLGHMAGDKKVRGGQITFILARGIGESFIAHQISRAEVKNFISQAINA